MEARTVPSQIFCPSCGFIMFGEHKLLDTVYAYVTCFGPDCPNKGVQFKFVPHVVSLFYSERPDDKS